MLFIYDLNYNKTLYYVRYFIEHYNFIKSNEY